MHKDTPTMLQYRKLKEQHPECLLFFRLGDFYELFFDDAIKAAEALDIVLTARGKKNDQPIPMCGVPVHASENYLARLVKKGFHIAICEQMETASEATGGLIKRDVVRIVTPGTLVEDHLLESRACHFLAALVDDPCEEKIGIAFLELSTGDFFVEHQPYGQLFTALQRIAPKEILMAERLCEKDPFAACWQNFKKITTLLPQSRFDVAAGQRRLESFFNVKTLDAFGVFSDAEAAAGGALVDYVLLTQKREMLSLSRPRKLHQDHFVGMDAFTLSNLEIFTTLSGKKEGSLLDTMDMTITPMGSRLLSLRFSHPLRQLSVIQERLDSITCFVEAEKACRTLRELLKGIPDIERACARLMLGRQTPKDLAAIRTTLLLLTPLTKLLQTMPLSKELSTHAERLLGYDDLAQKLHKAFVEDWPATLREGGIIKKGYDDQLDALRDRSLEGEGMMVELREKYVRETGIQQLKISYNNLIGYFIEVPSGLASKMPFQFTHKQTMTSAARFVTQELQTWQHTMLTAKEEALRYEMHLVEEILQELRSLGEPLKAMTRALAVLDVSSALASYATEHHYTRPVLDTSTELHIKDGRHPVVERFVKDNPFVPNDCALDDRMWLLTGPNMAGKSTFLRQNALIVFLAHIGSFVPASYAKIGLVDRLFSRVGASDDLARGYSTFMVEMVETAAILHQATSKSFVILDEIGRGTSTYDGLALAFSCAEHLLDSVRCRTLFATHYHELTALSGRDNVMCCTLSMTSFDDKMVFLHKVIPGVSLGSYGLYVARLAGLPDRVLQRASSLLAVLEDVSQKEHQKLQEFLRSA